MLLLLWFFSETLFLGYSQSQNLLVGIEIKSSNFDVSFLSKYFKWIDNVENSQTKLSAFVCFDFSDDDFFYNEALYSSIKQFQVPYLLSSNSPLFCSLEHPDVLQYDGVLQMTLQSEPPNVSVESFVKWAFHPNLDWFFISKPYLETISQNVVGLLNGELNRAVVSKQVIAILESLPPPSTAYHTSTQVRLTESQSSPLPHRASEEKFHSDGSCNLWWPLNHSEIFLYAKNPVSSTSTSSSSIYSHIEPVIFICPGLSPLSITNEYVIAIEYLSMGDVVTNANYIGEKTPKVAKMTLLGESIFSIASQIMIRFDIPLGSFPSPTHHQRVKLSICPRGSWQLSTNKRVSVKKSSSVSCISSFDVTLQVKWGDDVVSSQVRRNLHPMVGTLGSRDIFGYALKMMGHNQGVFVEIGVNKGHYAQKMLSQWDGNRYVLIDPWTPAPTHEYVDIANADRQSQHDEVFREAIRNVSPYGKRAVFIKDTSLGAAALMVNSSVDVVYIDGLHHYQGVMDDIHAWWPKIKAGGIMAGHDYMLSSDGPTIFTVKPAVDEFARHMGLVVFQTHDSYPTWFIFKE
jgi:hypothetical protein